MLGGYIGSCYWMYQDTLRRGKSNSEAGLWAVLGLFFPLCIVPVYLIARQASPGITGGSAGFNMMDSSPQTQIKIDSTHAIDMGKRLGKAAEILDYNPVKKRAPETKALPPPVKKKKAYSTIFDAIKDSALEQIREKVSTGTDINMQDSRGATPLHLAMKVDSRSLTELLISLGADIKSEDFEGKTPLHWAAAAGANENIDRLLSSYPDMNARDYDGQTPLHDAARNGHPETANRLILKGADPNIEDYEGKTPLDIALSTGNKAVESVLRINGAREKR